MSIEKAQTNEPNTAIKTAVEKIAQELKDFKGDNKAKAVSTFVASTLTHFCEENEQFAEVVARTPRTISDCCAEVMKGCGSSISDIDVYRGAVKHYFPNAEVHMLMEIHIEGDAPSEEEIMRKPEPPKESKAKKNTGAKKAVNPDSSADSDETAASSKADAPTEQPVPEPKKPEVLQLSLF